MFFCLERRKMPGHLNIVNFQTSTPVGESYFEGFVPEYGEDDLIWLVTMIRE
jgi:hypothetical protein